MSAIPPSAWKKKWSRANHLRNDYEIRGDSVVIKMQKKTGDWLEAFIDLDDFPRVYAVPIRFVAVWNEKCQRHYAMGYPSMSKKNMSLHRLITDAPPDLVVDHIDHDGLNDKALETRTIPPKKRRGTVYYSTARRKWYVQFRVTEKRTCLGSYATQQEAEAALVSKLREMGI